MDVGVGLPNTIPGATGEQQIESARRADAAGFKSLGSIDRLVYPNFEPLVVLAGAAAVTERIRLASTVLLAPYRANAALIAKQAASVHRLSRGRLTLGLGIGWREDDYEASGVPWEERGRRFDALLGRIRELWAASADDKGLGPDVASDPPEVILGGAIDKAFARAAEHGSGWMLGGGTPEQFAEGKEKLEAAWRERGRDGSPRALALNYYSLGSSAEDAAHAYLTHYYAKLGSEAAEATASSAATSPDGVRERIKAFEDVGCDELVLMPCSPEPDQVDLLADAAL